MAEFDGTRPQINDPDLITEIVRLLTIRGRLGELNVSDEVGLNLLMGSVGFLKSLNFPVAFDFAAFVSNGVQTAAAASTVHALSGTLPAGIYDVFVTISHEVSLGKLFSIETVPTTQQILIFIERDATLITTNFAIEIVGAPQAIQVTNLDAFGAGERSTATLAAVPRPSPGFTGTLGQ